jgi:hypothetical protein
MKWFFLVLTVSLFAVAQDAAVIPPVQSGLEHIIALIAGLADKIPGGIPAALASVLGIVSEIAMRLWPTAKPKSWLLLVAKIGHLIADLCRGAAALVEKASGLLDNVAQNIKE